MIDTTGIDLQAMITTPLRKVSSARGGEYHGPCPFCGGTDRFALWPADNKWSCRHCVDENMTPKDAIDFVMRRDNLDLTGAMASLGLSNGTSPTQRPMTPQEYASKHGLDWEDLERAGFQSITYQNPAWADDPCNGRPALEFATRGGKRWRFLDKPEPPEKPKYKSETGFTQTWYGLDERVMDNARKDHAPLVICNGEVSAIAGRFWGIPAISIGGGAEKSITESLLTELLTRWDGRIAIAMDCDEHGRKAGESIRQQLGDRGAVIDLGLMDGQDLADFASLHGSHSTREIKRRMPLPPQAPVTSREAARLTILRLDEDVAMDGKPIILPFRSWHQFGGYAKIGWPGKLTGGVGMSGHGKTSWLNTAIDHLCKRGENGIGLMPEFDGDEYQWDRLQRYSGYDQHEPLVTAEKMMEWELWKTEKKFGIPPDLREGRVLTPDEKRAVERVSLEVEGWPGEFKLFPMDGSLESALLLMGDEVQDRRTRGELVTYAAFDYIQIIKSESKEDDDNTYEQTVDKIKKFCMRYKIHGLVTSQVNKTADKSARDGNKILNTTDMRYARDDKFNLLVTLNVMYDETGQMVKLAGSSYYAAVANIAKNNKGRKGRINMIADFVHLRWLDKSWTRNQIDLNGSSPMLDEQLQDL